MLKKLYLIALGILVLPSALLIYYAGSWLHSIGDAKAAQEEYFFYSGLGLTVLLISSGLLFIGGNVILWTTRRAWALWLSFAFFALFTFLRFWWLEGAYLDFAMRNSLTDNKFSLGPIVAVVLILGVGALVFFDQFVVLRLAEKMHPAPAEADSGDAESAASQSEPPAVVGG